MKYSVLGRTGMRVSTVCLGTATFGVTPDSSQAERIMHAAFETR